MRIRVHDGSSIIMWLLIKRDKFVMRHILYIKHLVHNKLLLSLCLEYNESHLNLK